MTLLLVLSACNTTETIPPLKSGTLTVCLDGAVASGGADVDLAFTGTLESARAEACGYTLTINAEDGTSHTVAVNAQDEEGAALDPDLSAAEGTVINLTYRSHLVFGTVTGFYVTDDAGLLLAADEGTWGGAFTEEDVPGLAVRAGTDMVAFNDGSCGNDVGTAIVFTGDLPTELTPVSQGELTVAGTTMTATALDARTYEGDDGCSMSDPTDHLTWMVSR